MNDKISIVIRNKNESKTLGEILNILNRIYLEYIQEIIVVDNKSTDNSLEVARKYGCKIVSIEKFSYGRAINIGIEAASSRYILLLSSHAIPIGSHFFYNAVASIKKDNSTAGIRFINSFDNYNRALNNNFIVKEPLKFGLMAACCLVNKQVWEIHKFNEELVFSEDKEWSKRVSDLGYKILDLNETFFYFIQRDEQSLLNRYRNETLSYYQLNNKEFPSPLRILLTFIKKIFVTNVFVLLKTMKFDFLILKERMKIFKLLKMR